MSDAAPRKLLRSLNLADLLVLSSSSMAPAYSLAAVMGLVVAAAGLGAPFALVVSTIPIAFIAVGFMRLTKLMPSAGAVYTWTRAAFGNRVSWFMAVLVLIAYFFSVIATALPTGVYTLKLVLPSAGDSPLAIAVAGVAWIAFSTYFLIIGARPTALLSAIFLAVEVAAILLIAGIAFAHPYTGTPAPQSALAGLTLGSFGWSGIMAGALLSVWITAGWEISSYSSEESSKGGGSAGAAALIGLLATFAIVLVCEIAFLRIGTVGGFAQHQDDALAFIASRLGGGWIQLLMTATVLVSSAAAIWTSMLILSRSIFAMSRDGLLPHGLAAVHSRYGSPWIAILLVSVPSAAVMLIAGLGASAQATLLNAVGGASLFLGATFIIGAFACVTLYATREPGRHVLTGIVLPALGGVGTLALVIRYVATQDRFFQALAAGGMLLAFIFALTAGLWSRIPAAEPIAREEA